MIPELVLVTAWSVTGWSAVSLAGLNRDHRVIAILIAPLIGLAITTVTGGLTLAIGVDGQVEVIAAVAIAVSIAAAFRTPPGRRIDCTLGVAASMGIAGTVAAAVRLIASPILTFDSYKFIKLGRTLESNDLSISSASLADYPIVGLEIQAFGRALGAEFVIAAPATAGLLGIVGAGSFIVQAVNGRVQLSAASIAATLVSGTVLALSSYMLRLQFSLLNSHLVVAGLLSVGAAAALATANTESHRHMVPVSAMALSALAMTRAEGPLVVALVMIALVADQGLPRRTWRQLGTMGVLPAAVWYWRLATAGASGDILSPTRSAFMIGVLAAPVAVLAIPQLDFIRRWLVPIAFGALTCAISGLAVAEPEGFGTSAATTAGNLLTTGSWGAVWWLLVPAIAMGIMTGPTLEREDSWLLILLGFGGLVMILGGIRDFPFRAGFGDSGNRMMIHIVPLAFLFVIVKTLVASRRRSIPI